MILRLPIIVLYLFACPLFSSGAYDHGTSTGKGKLQIDLTWNPFNYFKNGQSYVVLGYGLTNKLDLHGYYSNHGNYNNGVNSHYYGIFYQIHDSKHLDLSTAIGKRKMADLDYNHIFFPQILYNIKLNKEYTIGGSMVNVVSERYSIFRKTKSSWLTFDIALFIPITKYISKIKRIDEMKIGIGFFNNGLNKKNEASLFFPTYSVDIKLNI